MTAMTMTGHGATRKEAPKGRLMRVVRLQYLSSRTFVWMPLLILAVAWVFTVATFAMVHAVAAESGGTGGAQATQAPLWYLLAVGVASMTTTFPFSQALSITRREFFLGTVVSAVFCSGGMALAFVLLGWVESLTDGYGVGAYFSYIGWVWERGPVLAWAAYFVLGMCFFVIGFWIGTVFKRFGRQVLTLCIVGLVLVLLGLIALITLTRSWPDVIRVVADLGCLSATVLGVVVTVLVGVGAYLTLRRMPA